MAFVDVNILLLLLLSPLQGFILMSAIKHGIAATLSSLFLALDKFVRQESNITNQWNHWFCPKGESLPHFVFLLYIYINSLNQVTVSLHVRRNSLLQSGRRVQLSSAAINKHKICPIKSQNESSSSACHAHCSQDNLNVIRVEFWRS